MIERVTLDIILFLTVILLPWWVTALLALALMFYLPAFYEGVIALFIVDVIFGAPIELFDGAPYVLTILGTTAFLIIQILRSTMRVYSRF